MKMDFTYQMHEMSFLQCMVSHILRTSHTQERHTTSQCMGSTHTTSTSIDYNNLV